MHEGWLKFTVIALGVLIFLGLGGIVYTVIERGSEQLSSRDAYSIDYAIPEGWRVLRERLSGERLVITFERDGVIGWRVYDISRGELLGELSSGMVGQ